MIVDLLAKFQCHCVHLRDPFVTFQIQELIDLLKSGGDQKAIRSRIATLREYTWELIHAKHWKFVKPQWRDAYALAVLSDLTCSGQEESPHPKVEMALHADAIKRADLALLLGWGRFRRELQAAIQGRQDLHLELERRCKSVRDGMLKRKKVKALVRARPLPTCPSGARMIDVARSSQPSCVDFFNHWFLTETPVVLLHCMDDWAALNDPTRTWSKISIIRGGEHFRQLIRDCECAFDAVMTDIRYVRVCDACDWRCA